MSGHKLVVCSLFHSKRDDPKNRPYRCNIAAVSLRLRASGRHPILRQSDGDNDNSGASPSQPFRSIQHALQLAQPGDTVHLGPGHYYQDVYTVRDGEPGKPITIVGTKNAVVHGLTSNRIFQVHHDYISLIGFTIDGLRRNAEPNRMGAFREKLLYVIGYDARDGVHHMRVLGMTFRNAGEECLRIKYFARDTRSPTHPFAIAASGTSYFMPMASSVKLFTWVRLASSGTSI